MVQTINTNVSGITRPGVFVNQTYIGSLPQPIASHAVGYIFVSTEADDYLSNKYSGLEPYVPTQVGSVDDYVRKSGGVPTSQANSAISYHAVKAFFDNAGSNAILYATRVTPTPEVLINLPEQAGTNYRLFTIKINGRYYGSFDMETVDSDGTPIYAILTTGIDSMDNAYDIFEYLTQTDPDFRVFYEAERTSTEVTNSEFRIYSRSLTEVPEVQEFRAYRLIDQDTPDLVTNVINLLSTHPDSVKSFYPVKNLAIRLNSKVSGFGIKYLSGASLAEYNLGLTVDQITDMSAATDSELSDLVRAYLTASGISVAVGQILAIAKDDVYTVATEMFPDAKVGYWTYAASGAMAIDDEVPTGNTLARTGYLPESVQVAYVDIAGENRVLISNGATPNEITQGFVDAITEVFEEKGISQYYKIEPETITYSGLGTNVVIPNNGYSLSSRLPAVFGYPSLRPDLDSQASPIVFSSAALLSSGVLTSAGGFAYEPYVGLVLYMGTQKLVVTTVTSSTQLSVTTVGGALPANVTIAAPAYIDQSEANGFYIFDYVSNIKITSTNGTVPPVFSGINRYGDRDPNVVQIPDLTETLGYAEYKYANKTKAADYSYAIRQALTSEYFAPGYILYPRLSLH